ncbi:hypothetical protein HYV21_00410 [Candidatus Microgenomates bacterium]|nr:hypothetical protein [Candidatus Microgenomates bacterium]
MWFFRRNEPRPQETSSIRRGENPPPRPKKEVKPWGKKERLLVAAILLITVLAGFISWLGGRGVSLPDVSLEVPSTTIELEK